MCDMIRREILDDEMSFTKIGWVYHFCAIPGEKSEFIPYWLEKSYKHFYGD